MHSYLHLRIGSEKPPFFSISDAQKDCEANIRVTRLGEFWLFVRLLFWAVFLISDVTPMLGLTFTTKKVVYFWKKTVWSTFWVIFFTNASGHAG
jgi:hypothetical protein